jgi:hypothetical protein
VELASQGNAVYDGVLRDLPGKTPSGEELPGGVCADRKT